MSKITRQSAKIKLTNLWFFSSAILAILITIQIFAGKYGEQIDEILAWLFYSITPILSIIISVLIADGKNSKLRNKEFERHFFRITIWLSLFYIVFLFATILVEPFSLQYAELSSFDIIHIPFFVIFRVLMQACVIGFISVFFLQHSGVDT